MPCCTPSLFSSPSSVSSNAPTRPHLVPSFSYCSPLVPHLPYLPFPKHKTLNLQPTRHRTHLVLAIPLPSPHDPSLLGPDATNTLNAAFRWSMQAINWRRNAGRRSEEALDAALADLLLRTRPRA